MLSGDDSSIPRSVFKLFSAFSEEEVYEILKTEYIRRKLGTHVPESGPVDSNPMKQVCENLEEADQVDKSASSIVQEGPSDVREPKRRRTVDDTIWTSEEMEALGEGLRRFSSISEDGDCTISWSKIYDHYGPRGLTSDVLKTRPKSSYPKRAELEAYDRCADEKPLGSFSYMLLPHSRITQDQFDMMKKMLYPDRD